MVFSQEFQRAQQRNCRAISKNIQIALAARGGEGYQDEKDPGGVPGNYRRASLIPVASILVQDIILDRISAHGHGHYDVQEMCEHVGDFL